LGSKKSIGYFHHVAAMTQMVYIFLQDDFHSAISRVLSGGLPTVQRPPLVIKFAKFAAIRGGLRQRHTLLFLA
jgi:hypothetical protein